MTSGKLSQINGGPQIVELLLKALNKVQMFAK